jgi:two-component system response regulator AtoC
MLSLKKLFGLDGTVLLTGETGTGKSWLAKQIHARSARADFPFVTVNLGAIQEALFESELFGHLRGAFTGAVSDRKGFCETAGRGTLFLDEIGELSPCAQKKLLRLLEERRFTPVGSCVERVFQSRIVAATNVNLAQMVREGRFRADLYYRLRVFHYDIPPVRTDRDKLMMHIHEFFESTKIATQKTNTRLTPECITALMAYSWPGNLRELKNSLDYAVNVSEGDIGPRDLPSWMSTARQGFDEQSSTSIDFSVWPEEYGSALCEFEKQFLHHCFKRYNGRVNQTARELRISKATLIAKARKYAIDTMRIRLDARDCQNGFQGSRSLF